MKRTFTLIASASVVLSGLTGPAHAYPVKGTKLTANALYGSGVLDTSECPEKPIKKNSVPVAKVYLKAVLACLNGAWSAQLEKSGQAFSKPHLKLVTKNPKRFCGEKWESIYGYCYSTQTMLFVLDHRLLKYPEDLYNFYAVASVYGDHVQYLTGVTKAYLKLPERNKAEGLEQGRRLTLQAACYASVFIGSAYGSLDRTDHDWTVLVGDVKLEAVNWFGTKTNIAYWMNRGFTSHDPGSCNTWTAPSKRVA
ncbi:neutral zinc metallopeptidase [Streptosporangiaceae bacterium NEAU-GS5]|nr:neutral zinc metallopeptidase [Streptosporangiaceae bacterium NEAU-GS5]